MARWSAIPPMRELGTATPRGTRGKHLPYQSGFPPRGGGGWLKSFPPGGIHDPTGILFFRRYPAGGSLPRGVFKQI